MSVKNRKELRGDRPDGEPLVETRLRICIPSKYHSEPILSRLVSQYGLTVNFAAAMLGANARDDGWFDLDVKGTRSQLDSACIYLNDLDLEVWQESS